MAMLIWGGRVRILSSHNGEENYFNLLLKDVRAGKLPYSVHRTTFTEALDKGLFDRVKLILGARLKQKTRPEWEAVIRAQYGEDASEELDCIPRQGSGVYIPRTLVERAQVDGVPVVRLVKPEGYELDDNRTLETTHWINDVLKPVVDAMRKLRSVLGQDFGRDGDLSYVSVLQDEGGGRWHESLALELRRIPFDVQHTIIKWLLAELPLWHHAKFDARGNGQSARRGRCCSGLARPARIECVMADARQWYAANIPAVQGRAGSEDALGLDREGRGRDRRPPPRASSRTATRRMDAGRDKGSRRPLPPRGLPGRLPHVRCRSPARRRAGVWRIDRPGHGAHAVQPGGEPAACRRFPIGAVGAVRPRSGGKGPTPIFIKL
jgi:hypothetical protein